MTSLLVAAAVIERDDAFLVTRRQAGVHLAGYWEFPGGKCEPGESVTACLAREIREELDVEIRIGRTVFTTSHAYPDRLVELHFLETQLLGEPRPQIGQEMQWIPRHDLASLDFPPADAELIRLLMDEGHGRH